MVNDLILLDKIEEKDVFNHLKERYQNGQIYTYIGNVLIALNPYRILEKNGISIYDMKNVDQYRGLQMHQVEPHPFAVAESAYSHLSRYSMDQCIIITGESGSGKTETSKHIMQYIATVSTQRKSKILSSSSSFVDRRKSIAQNEEMNLVVEHVKSVLWSSNPVLEAFGNAQTIRNSNSSRFGKYMILQLNYSGQVIGGIMEQYLLERSRVISQADGERNFHAFYHLLQGIEEKQERDRLDLRHPSAYAYLQWEYRELSHTNDKEMYQRVIENMNQIGIPKEEQQMVYQLLAATLWLGNIVFEATENNGSDIAETSMEILEHVGTLIGLEIQTLKDLLTSRRLTIRDGVTVLPLTIEKASQVRHALAKELYENVFKWLIAKINEEMSIRIESMETKSCSINLAATIHQTIGILDIYGFEIFQVNAFEQLCINYVNEKLQHLFIQQTLEKEQMEYQKECIEWKSIPYFDNQIVCQLIDDVKSSGIFPLLDEQCAVSDYSIPKLMKRFHKQYEKHPHYLSPRINIPEFGIIHYAGNVQYDVTNFVDSNMNIVFNDLHDAMEKSSNLFLHQIFQDTRSLKEKRKRPPSTSFQFRQQVQNLLDQLRECNSHYIRCIKPNDTKQALRVEKDLFLHQLRYLGVQENLRVRRAGYCFQQTYDQFLQRFKMLSPKTWPHPQSHSTRQATLDLLSNSNLTIETEDGQNLPFQEDSKTVGCYALGKTKIFLKHPRGLFALENLRIASLPNIVKILEKAYKQYLMRVKIFYYQQAYQLVYEKFELVWKSCQERKMRRPNAKAHVSLVYKEWEEVSMHFLPPSTRFHHILEREEESIPIIWGQSFVRAQNGKRQMKRLKQAVAVFSAYWKGLKVRRQMPSSHWTICHEAMLGIRSELERFMGQKKRRRNSLDRKYKGDYIDVFSFPRIKERILSNHNQKHVYFCAPIIKINQRFAYQERVLLVTEACILNLKGSKYKRLKERRCIPLNSLSKLSLSPYSDDYVVFHVDTEYDYLMEIDYKTELVQTLRKRFRKLFHRELPIQFSTRIEFMAYRNVPHVLEFQLNKEISGVTREKVDKRFLRITVGNIQKKIQHEIRK